MALTIPCAFDRTITVDEYVERIQRDVDLRSVDSIAASAPLLRGLANDRNIVVSKLNARIMSYLDRAPLSSAQTLFLAKGQGFVVRANVWPANADVTNGRAYQDQFAYNLAHDHNFTFMTVNYLGPGYETEIYEYSYESVEGYIGEQVDLHFLEKTKLSTGSVMLYRAGRDVHIQYAPPELTVTLNLMVALPEEQLRDQFHFDVSKRVITGHPDELLASRRTSLVTLAGLVGNEETQALLEELAKTHPCRRTRLTALQALARQRPKSQQRIWELATADPAPLVANTARRKLRELDSL